MKKLFWALGLLLLLTACGQREEAVEGNLILTNYAPESISQVSVEYAGGSLLSEAAIADTQLCSFSLPEEAALTYTVSFETAEGETVRETFTGSFAAGETVYLRADREDGSWRLDYDSVS
ncbi:MAG: hypothetical protein HFG09_06765 [Oscillibacter sp.]|nr:hypothetical protein [Oscillibacter sp.]